MSAAALCRVLGVGAGSAVGGGFRLLIQEGVILLGGGLPVALFAATVGINALAGGILGWLHRDGNSRKQSLFWTTGFCGGFSTFSLFSWETLLLSTGFHWSAALLYLGGSLGLALGFYAWMRRMPPVR